MANSRRRGRGVVRLEVLLHVGLAERVRRGRPRGRRRSAPATRPSGSAGTNSSSAARHHEPARVPHRGREAGGEEAGEPGQRAGAGAVEHAAGVGDQPGEAGDRGPGRRAGCGRGTGGWTPAGRAARARRPRRVRSRAPLARRRGELLEPQPARLVGGDEAVDVHGWLGHAAVAVPAGTVASAMATQPRAASSRPRPSCSTSRRRASRRGRWRGSSTSLIQGALLFALAHRRRARRARDSVGVDRGRHRRGRWSMLGYPVALRGD